MEEFAGFLVVAGLVVFVVNVFVIVGFFVMVWRVGKIMRDNEKFHKKVIRTLIEIRDTDLKAARLQFEQSNKGD